MDDIRGIPYLRRKLNARQNRVNLRYKQYDMKHQELDPGLTIPPRMRQQYKATIGWCGGR